MSAPVFLVEPARLDGATDGGRIVLDGPEGRHAATVRRIRVGERVHLADGHGRLVQCRVLAAQRDVLELEVLARWEEPTPEPRLVVVQALAKGDRGEAAVEAMTEVGVDLVVPWAASRSVTRWEGERGTKALSRWRAVAREAGKQARRARLPVVAEPATTGEVAGLLGEAALGVVLHEEAVTPLATLAVPSEGDLVLVVGPEGGIAPEESEAFAAAGAQACRLGPTVLRTSTAGVAALAVVLARTARWGTAPGV